MQMNTSDSSNIGTRYYVLVAPVNYIDGKDVAYVYSNCFSDFWLFLANFERPVLGCIEADLCK